MGLTDIFNYSLIHNTIPNIWKLAKIIPILKPNKSPTEPSSHRPISLICTPSKILERLVLNHISPHIPTSHTQHSFKPQHSTTTQAGILNKHYSNICRLPHRHEDRVILRRLHAL